MIRIEHLVKQYGGVCAVNDVSLTVGEGEIVGLLGPNGAGKTTTMNILTGCLSSTAGRVSVGGIDMLEDPLGAKRLIGYLPEQPPLYLDMTVDEYLRFHYELKRCRLNRAEHLAEICEVTRIGDARRRVIRHLSKGYRQRVGIAGALVGNPPVILLDEPTIGLDPKQIIEARNLIRGLGKSRTVILSTHILQEAQAVCGRIVILNKGRVVADERTENITRAMESSRRLRARICGAPSQVLPLLKDIPGVASAGLLPERDGDASTYLVESADGADVRRKLFFTLAERGFALVGLEPLGMNLEDIFITVVDRTDGTGARPRYERRSSRAAREGRERRVAESLVADAERRRAEGDPPDAGPGGTERPTRTERTGT